MKFLCYCSDFELSLQYDDKYDFSNGIICNIDNVTHLAIGIGTLSSRQTISYAVFDWQEKNFGDKNTNIQIAEDIASDVVRFANSTIESSHNVNIPLHIKESIQSALKYSQTYTIGNFKGEQSGININMVETGTEQESIWTININSKPFTILNNKRASDLVFKGLCESVNRYIKAWISSLKR